MSVRYGIYGGDIMYLSIPIFTGKDSNKAYDKHVIESFDSGDFIRDWYNAVQYVAKYMIGYEMKYSDGIKDFINLSDLYEEAYLKNVNKQWLLSHDKPNDSERSFQLYVNKGECPSWEEFKNYCSTI